MSYDEACKKLTKKTSEHPKTTDYDEPRARTASWKKRDAAECSPSSNQETRGKKLKKTNQVEQITVPLFNESQPSTSGIYKFFLI